MALTKRTVVSALSALYLLFLTLLSAYSMHTSRLYSLPIPTALSAFTLALPLISGLTMLSVTSLSTSRSLLKSSKPSPQPQWQSYALLALTVLSTVLATLNGTHLPSSAIQSCALDTKWRSMFRQHNGKSIQRIQDAFDCCGLHSVLDMAFPFPSKNVGADTCTKTFGRSTSCFTLWAGAERQTAGLGLVVILGVVVWEVLILTLFNSTKVSWWSHVLGPEEENETENQINSRRALRFGEPGERSRYLDQPAAAVEEEIDESVDGGGAEAALGQLRVQPSQLRDETEQWASERRE